MGKKLSWEKREETPVRRSDEAAAKQPAGLAANLEDRRHRPAVDSSRPLRSHRDAEFKALSRTSPLGSIWLKRALISLLILGLLAAGCSGTQEPEASSTTSPPTTPSPPTTMTSTTTATPTTQPATTAVGNSSVEEALEALPATYWEFHSSGPASRLVPPAPNADVAADLVAFCEFLANRPGTLDEVLDEMRRLGISRAAAVGESPTAADVYMGVLGDGMVYVCPEDAAYADALLAGDPGGADLSADEREMLMEALWQQVAAPVTRWPTFPNEAFDLATVEQWATEACSELDGTGDIDGVIETLESRVTDRVPDATEDESTMVPILFLGYAVQTACPQHLEALLAWSS